MPNIKFIYDIGFILVLGTQFIIAPRNQLIRRAECGFVGEAILIRGRSCLGIQNGVEEEGNIISPPTNTCGST